MAQSRVWLALAFSLVVTAACTQASMPGDGSDNPGPGHDAGVSGTQQTDWAAIVRLEDQAKAIAKTTGCTTANQCRSAPVGSRACGGPRYYIQWCASSTDSASLYAKLDQVATAERAYNKKYNLISTCEFRTPPAVDVVAGACTAK